MMLTYIPTNQGTMALRPLAALAQIVKKNERAAETEQSNMKFQTDLPADRPIRPMVLDYPMSIMTMPLLLMMNAEERCRRDEKQNDLCTRHEEYVVSSIDRDVAPPPPLPIKLRFIFQTSSLIIWPFRCIFQTISQYLTPQVPFLLDVVQEYRCTLPWPNFEVASLAHD